MTSAAKLLIALPPYLLGGFARLSLLAVLLVVPVGLGVGNNTLVFVSIAAYADDNTKINDARNNPPDDVQDNNPGDNPGDNNPGDNNPGDNPSDNNPSDNPSDNSSESANNGNGSNTSLDNDDDGASSENHRGAVRPANLTEFLSSLRNGSRIVNAERGDNEIKIKYSDGWQEQIIKGEYTLEGPNDNVVIRRPATKRDYERLNSAF